MHLLLIGAQPPPTGGDAIWTINYSKQLIADNIEVKIINTSLLGKRAHKLGSKNNIFIELKRACSIWLKTLANLIFFKPIIVHFNSNCSPQGIIRDFLTICIVNMKGIPLIMHCHANVPDSIGNSKISITFLRLCLKRAARVIVLNSQSEIYCNQIGNIVSTIIPNFIDENEISINKTIPDVIKNIIFVGHMIKTKGIMEIFEVAKQFPEITFIMAGSLTPDIEGLELPTNITLLGNIEPSKLKEVLDYADLFLFPTYTEGFPLALLEAMAHGLPVITTPVGANQDMLESNGGIFTQVKAVDEICNALEKLQSPDLRKEMSEWNIWKVQNSYTAPKVIRKIKNLYNSALNNEYF
jgi:glycosyltransferase involved in cell wall biosynthesis